MTKQVPWNKYIVEAFIEDAMLSETEQMVLRTRVAGWSRQKQATTLNISISTLDKCIAGLKKKYDNCQKFNPLLPPRKESSEETWMDEH